jgi:tripartite-type tricarboxylate transporter receptor subunit TctC
MQSHAADFPRQPVRIVTANAAGGAADINARRLAERLNKKWDQPVIVQNLASAGGSVAAVAVATATPNGHTLLFAFHPLIAVNPILYAKLPFDADRDFAPVVLLTNTPHVLLVNAGFPATTVAEFVEVAKARPGSLNFGSGGAGSSMHLAAELLKQTAGIDIRHVPYKGAAPAATALMGNEIQLLFDATTTATGHIRGGRLRGLAIAALVRAATLPELPTFDESGMRGFESAIGHGIMVPAKTPSATIEALNKAINEAIREPEYAKPMTEGGALIIGGTARQFREYLDIERRKWADIIKRQGIKAD